MADAAERPLVPTIVGSTAVGKTGLAAALAAHLPVTVISADARQVYRGLDIGTAKPDPALQAHVPHSGLDVVDPGERYSAGWFARDAVTWIARARAAGRQPIVVGGTGLYIRALADGLFREPPLDLTRRERLRQWSAQRSGPEVARWAARLDPRYGGGGRQRAVRVIEIGLLTGRPLSWWQAEARATGIMRPWYIHLTLPRDVLHRRIAERIDRMLATGLVDEVRSVLAAGVPPTAPGLDAVGYREVVQMVQGQLAPGDLREAIVTATRRYAKRQETWFRHQLRGSGAGRTTAPSVWTIDATAGVANLVPPILDRWREHAAARP